MSDATAQRSAALALAQQRKREAAALRAMLRAGELGVLDVLEGDVSAELADAAGALLLERVLLSGPFVGSWKVARILEEAGASPVTRVRDLARLPHTSRLLVQAVRTWAPAAARVRRGGAA